MKKEVIMSVLTTVIYMTIITALLIIMKTGGTTDISWFLVFVPMGMGIIEIVVVTVLYFIYKRK